MSMVQVLGKKSRNGPRREVDLEGTHVILTMDVSEDDMKIISVPESMVEEIKSTIKIMGSVKIQFGVIAEFKNDEGELKTWQLSNSALLFNDEFINNGSQKLMEKLNNYTEYSSGWSLLQIKEITMTLTKFEEIINLSGITFINNTIHYLISRLKLFSVTHFAPKEKSYD